MHPDLNGALFFLPLDGLLGLRQEKKAGVEGGIGAQMIWIFILVYMILLFDFGCVFWFFC
ncbi:hypothetical protein B0A77_06795 [Flavobacterium branchiophilum]|uniref:Uncharacterized protein n=1 Tax=Flavobacterium branchiophilum TaxID=55197 RepID=A0A2H3KMT5_9FLAO|nr:hypothetical protein B0A77_06795 [Flavobacterium branchiophilum]